MLHHGPRAVPRLWLLRRRIGVVHPNLFSALLARGEEIVV